ncbi:hypothetical protein H2201_007221 [Coniosporium apollinis]|uniref:Uncharacterized protein n=1 Tax=Coniosporium apollinis TaxID=61459 RepID=A0ABQ9NLH9_9PEZI|nr:hypothetical protein H2201_007221 [Coniosporium apollinis]
MADIHQWRKKVPARSRASTPQSYDDLDHQNEAGSVGESHTPKRRSRPKLSSYISYLSGVNVSRPESIYKAETSSLDPFAHVKPREEIRAVNIDSMIGSLHAMLMESPLQSLSAQHNSRLFHLFEAYRNLAEEKENLQAKLTEEREHQLEILSNYRDAEKRWEGEEADYKAEIRRLELLVAQGEKGIAGVFRARQDSVLKKRQSRQDKPPSANRQTMYGFVGESKPAQDSTKERQTGGSSTFSCVGDPLPDEVEGGDDTITVSTNKEFQALRDMATIVARQRGVSIDDVLPSLVGLFTGTLTNQTISEPSPDQNMPQRSGSQAQTTAPEPRHLLPSLSESNLLVLTRGLKEPQSHEQSSASTSDSVVAGNASRERPRSYIRKGRRPFSFEPGDDNMRARPEEEGNSTST